MERHEHDQRGKGDPYEDTCIKATEDCGIIVSMKTVENKALMRIYRKDLTVSLVPYVEDAEELFLKTIIPSRKATESYFGGKK